MLASAFVLPGVGHWVLNKKIHAGLFIAAALYCFIKLTQGMYAAALILRESIGLGQVKPDFFQMRELLMQAPEVQSLDSYLAVLVLIWVVALIDTYRIGSAQNTATKAEG